MDRSMGEPQNRSGHGSEEENSQLLTGLEPPIIQPVAQLYTTELSRSKAEI
jgi:mRNA degradation ribonuclease J1/J2